VAVRILQPLRSGRPWRRHRGYSAAFRAARFGQKVALVDANKIGGTCLHSGCIPTKAMLESASSPRSPCRSMTRLRMTGRRTLDRLVAAGVAGSRAEAPRIH
jgi:hypothetical protein